MHSEVNDTRTAVNCSSYGFLNALVAGGVAGIFVDIMLFPIDTIKTRLQSKSGFMKSGGFSGIYKGLSPAAVGSAPSAALFFFTYENLKSYLSSCNFSEHPTSINMVSASVAEVAACLVRVPVEIAKQRLQVLNHKEKQTAIQILWSSYKTEGLAHGIYRGFGTTIMREIPFSLIQFPLWEYLKIQWQPLTGLDLTPLSVAACGAAAGGISAGLTTPLDVAKTRIMLAKRNSLINKLRTIDVFKTIYEENGIKGLFAGFIPRVLWITLGGAIFFGFYDSTLHLLFIIVMLYCPPNITFSKIWIDHGVSHCFMDTVGSAICGGFILIFGTIQLLVYRKYATRVTDSSLLCRSRLYDLQLFLLSFFPILNLVRFLWNTQINTGSVYGYMVLSTVFICVAYPYSIYLVKMERCYQLPSLPTKGHGLILLLFWTLSFVNESLSFINLRHKEWWFHLNSNSDRVEMGFFVTRYLSSLLIFVLGLKAPGISFPYSRWDSDTLGNNDNTNQGSAFRNAFKKLRKLIPYLWPKNDIRLKIHVVICIALLIGGRVIKLFLPIYRKKLVDSLIIEPKLFRWDFVLSYVALSFLQGGGTGTMGLFNNLRSFLWIKVQQYTTREIEVDLFQHLHNLSLRWHLQRKTGEVLRIMDRGTDSINNLLNYIIFSIAPTIADLLVAVLYFIYAFNWWFGLIVFLTMFLYILVTILITEWRTKFQRRMNLADNEQRARSVDSLLNFETVKYYAAEQYEVNSYREAILKFQKEEFNSSATLNILNMSQNVILCLGLLSGSLLSVYLVIHHQGLTVGDFVLFFTYLMDLYMPLNWFGTYYRAIQKNFVDMENMFDLLKEEEEVVDAPGCPSLLTTGGGIEFNNVTFGYSPENQVLKNVSFNVAPGKTVAIVGPSGSGKSTIVRLLFRFYDVQSGSILIDGQNIKLVTQQSLRHAIGVVPQDTVLFNNTIFYNIQYGKIGAEVNEVYEAARLADIHDRILSFPDSYETKVGERGLRLSGGEKQRVAIARTLLKGPVVVLLDEATSALDTNTERNIQSALHRVCANRTTIVIAHRLSTIINADQILVLKDGTIVERGRHEELLERQNGLYSDMWQRQLEKLKNPEDMYNSLETLTKVNSETST